MIFRRKNFDTKFSKLAEKGKIQNVDRNNFRAANDRQILQQLYKMKLNELQNSKFVKLMTSSKLKNSKNSLYF